MATNYPSALDTTTELPNNRTDATATATNHVADHNNLSDAVRAIEGELGTDPSGSETTVARRLAANDGERLWFPTGAIAQTYDRRGATFNGNTLSGGVLQVAGGMVLPGGKALTSITVLSSTTPGASMTHQWFCLVDTSRNVLCKTADDTSTAWGASAAKTLAISGGYTPSADIAVWIGIVVTIGGGGTLPNINGLALSTAHGNLTPLLGGRSTTGLTDPASLGSTITAPTARAEQAYAYVS